MLVGGSLRHRKKGYKKVTIPITTHVMSPIEVLVTLLNEFEAL